MKKHIINIAFISLCIILLSGLIIIKNENLSLKNKIQEQNEKIEKLEETIKYNSKQIELNSCPICNGSVKIFPVLESFYIECELCGLQTDYFKSKKELVEYWNNRIRNE